MIESIERIGMGWIPDYPDVRDYTMDNAAVAPLLASTLKANGKQLPKKVDLRRWCSPIENQLSLGSCTAHAGVGLVEYFERRAFGRHMDASRLFLYKVTRNLLQWQGDRGAFLRTTMGALTLFGVPPEEYYPYHIPDFDQEPSPFCYAFAQNFQTIKYYRFDPPGTPRTQLLKDLKESLAAGLPVIFGFTVYDSYVQANTTGKIPFPTRGERVVGGHAVMAVGFDETMKISNNNLGGMETTGAIHIRNSWGTGWGDQGYGWLPYDYVLNGLAVDAWTILKKEWVDTGQFK